MDRLDFFRLYKMYKERSSIVDFNKIKEMFENYSSYPKEMAIEYFGEEIVKECIEVGLLREGSYDNVIPCWDEVDSFEDFINFLLMYETVTYVPEVEEDEGSSSNEEVVEGEEVDE